MLSANDKNVLRYLADNPLASNHTIATSLKIHHATVASIRKKLEQDLGLRYRAEISPKKAGLDDIYVIYFKFSSNFRIKDDYENFSNFLKNQKNVVGLGFVMHSRWDGWFKVIQRPHGIDYAIFTLKRELGPYIDSFEIIKHVDSSASIGSEGSDMNNIIDML